MKLLQYGICFHKAGPIPLPLPLSVWLRVCVGRWVFVVWKRKEVKEQGKIAGEARLFRGRLGYIALWLDAALHFSVRKPSTFDPKSLQGLQEGKVEIEIAWEYLLPLHVMGIWDSGQNLRLLGVLPSKSPPCGRELAPLKGAGSSYRPVLGMTSVFGLAHLFFPFGMKDPPQAVTLILSLLVPGRDGGRRKE